MAINWQGQNVIGPFSLVQNFEYPPAEGFMFFPVDDSNPAGWGKPFAKKKPVNTWADPAVPEYEDLPYGTSGGKDAIKHLYRALDKKTQQYKWVWAKAPGDQVYGNIDWIGPYLLDSNGTRTGAIEKRRERISYNGPPMRYFAAHVDDFYYGADTSHEEIYYQGRYLAIAPKPVLGACFRIERVPDLDANGNKQYDPITGELLEIDEKWLLAICKDGLKDILYRRPYPAETIKKGDMDDSKRASFKSMKGGNNPSGWESLFSFPQQPNAYTPETPWFFNESGTEAVASRRFEDSFNNGQSNVKEDGQYLLKCYVTDMATAKIALDTVANQEGTWGDKLVFTNTTKKDHLPIYTDGGVEDSWYGLFPGQGDTEVHTHNWQEDTIEITSGLTGQLIVARDYVGDIEIPVTAHFAKYRDLKQKFVAGVDDPTLENSLLYNISNNQRGETGLWGNISKYSGDSPGNTFGPAYDYPNAPGTPTTFTDHYSYIGENETGDIVLKWTHPTEGAQQFTLDQWIMGTKTQYDSDWKLDNGGQEGIYAVRMSERFIHFFDIRKKLVLYLEQEHDFLYNTQDPNTNGMRIMHTREVVEVASPVEASTPEGNSFILREELQEEEEINTGGYGFNFSAMQFGWRTIVATTETFTTTSWDGGWSTEDTSDFMKIDMGWDVVPVEPPIGMWPLINPRHNDAINIRIYYDYRRHLDYQKWNEDKYWHTTAYVMDYYWFDTATLLVRIIYTERELEEWLSMKMLLNTPRHNHRKFGIGRYTHVNKDLTETEWVFVSIMTEIEDKIDEPKNFLIKNLDPQGGKDELEKVLNFGTKYLPIGVY